MDIFDLHRDLVDGSRTGLTITSPTYLEAEVDHAEESRHRVSENALTGTVKALPLRLSRRPATELPLHAARRRMEKPVEFFGDDRLRGVVGHVHRRLFGE